MIFESFEAAGLAHRSYIIGCPRKKEVAVVDPQRDFDVYLDYIARESLQLTAILETHIPADYASGASALARATGAPCLFSAHEEGQSFAYRFPHERIRGGDRFHIGSIAVDVIFTPGHTPEHICFLVHGDESAPEKDILLSGDFLFCGSLGRPDILGDDAKTALAGQLFDSVHGPLADIDSRVTIFPAHGAGSL